jgi:hypothetical protein
VFAATRSWLKARSLEDDYLRRLPDDTRKAIVDSVASQWVPLEHAVAHYRTLEAMSLSHDTCVKLGGEVSRSINGIVLGTLGRLAGGLGASPTIPLGRSAKLFARNFRGGVVRVHRVADTEVRFEVSHCPLATSSAHRDTVEGSLLDNVQAFASSVRVREMTERRTPTSYAFRIRW